MKNLNCELKQKSAFAGFCLYLLPILFVLALGILPSCETDGDIPEVVISDPDAKDKTDVEEPKDTVLVLDESDVADLDKFYKPAEHKNVDFFRSDSKWNFVRSKQSDHFIVFWEEGFGENPNSSDVPAEYRVDIDDLLTKAESFFNININQLKFADLGAGTSNVDKYKLQIYLFYTQEWMAFGGGYDDLIGALWINPSTVHPVGSTIAHEIGHSFQYQTYADLLAYGGISNDFNRGYRYGYGGNGGNAFWEQCAQWQSFQSYPMEAFTSYNYSVHMDNYHRHFCHEWQRYASYWLHYYWAEKRGLDVIGKLWRECEGPEDPIETYMRINGLDVSQMNDELYDAYAHLVTWDVEAIRSNGSDFIGDYSYKLYQLEDGSYQVAYSKCPGTTGFNVIPLNVPDAGSIVTTSFRGLTPGSALADADPGSYTDEEIVMTTRNYNSSSLTRAGWRYGYVALLNDGTRVYGDMNKSTSADVEFTVPEGCKKLWFVVSGAPSSYTSHPWDEIESNDDQWPYKVSFTNTDLLGNLTIDPNATPESITLTYDISFAAADDYTGTTINLYDNGDINDVAEALVMQPSAIAGIMLGAKTQPQEGKIAFAAVEANGSLNYETTANGYGFWYDSIGDVTTWGSDNDSKLFTELTTDNFEFTIGQYPGKCSSGDKYTVTQALVYTKDSNQYQVTFEFNITIN